MTGKEKSKSKGPPRTFEGYPIIRGYIHKFVSELNETELKDLENILAREESEEEKDIFEEKLEYLNACQRRLTPLQKKVCRRVWEKEKTHEQTAKELGISKGSVETILKQIDNKYRKLMIRKFREHLKKNHPAKGSLDNT